MNWIRRLIVLSALGMGGAAAWLFLKSPLMRLQAIDVVLDPSSRDAFLFDRIRSGLKASLATYLGLPFWKVSLEHVLSDAKKDRRIETIQIFREFPHHLRVVVVPKKPLLGYMDGVGHIFPVARDATLMPSLTLKDSPDFPLLRGKEFLTDEKLREAAVQLMEAIPADGPFERKMVSEVVHSSRDGFSIFLSNQTAEIIMGDSDFELKAGRVGKVLGYMHNRGLKSRIIDARYSKKVVVRLRE